jgi:hypothetical protein
MKRLQAQTAAPSCQSQSWTVASCSDDASVGDSAVRDSAVGDSAAMQPRTVVEALWR